jgi:NhaA family Na+:H+ antiporter
MRATKIFQAFFNSEKAGGFVLIGCSLIAIAVANSPLGDGYSHFWHSPVAGHALEFWVNDGLMAIFFLLIGLEIERELLAGELRSLRNALLPTAAAVGGMVLPALIHFVFNHGTPYQRGFGIPMATDIAFSLGILSLLGSRVPVSLKIFLTAVAIIDDLGAILIIALFYSKGFSFGYFAAAMALFALGLWMRRAKVNQLWPYLPLGIAMWYCMHHSGIHATITGVLLAFAIPFSRTDEHNPSSRLEHLLHKPVAFLIMPIFALANTGIAVPPDWANDLTAGNSLGTLLGLFVGKPLGIFLAVLVALRLGWSKLPQQIRKVHIWGVGMLAGIGFTMSIFITLLAFQDPAAIVETKIAVLIASLLSGALGFLLLQATLPKKALDQEE